MKKFCLLMLLSGAVLTSAAEQPARGYRTIVDAAGDVKADISIYGGPTDSRFYAGVALSQGYQFNPWLFVGGGILVEQCVKDNRVFAAPVFAEGRLDLKLRRFTPFVDVRLGYNFANYGGVYFSPTVGYRVSLTRKLGLNIGVGYSMTGNRRSVESVTYPLGPDGMGGTNTVRRRVHHFDDTIALRLGVDF